MSKYVYFIYYKETGILDQRMVNFNITVSVSLSFIQVASVIQLVQLATKKQWIDYSIAKVESSYFFGRVKQEKVMYWAK